MARKRQQAMRPVDAVQAALDRELGKRGTDMKPIEVVKVAIAAYQAHGFAHDVPSETDATRIESFDRTDFRRGTQAAIDRMLFNANYWRAAYEQQIVEACDTSEDAHACLKATSVWTAHPLKLNTLSSDETIATFERFCPPFRVNNRRGSHQGSRIGKGPLSDLEHAIDTMAERASADSIRLLRQVLSSMNAEADLYEELNETGTLNALYIVLPAWCLQNRIELVSGGWWDDCDVMSLLIDALHAHFIEIGFGEAACQYFRDSCYEALDAYHCNLTVDPHPCTHATIPELVAKIQGERHAQPSFETDGYGGALPKWLIGKEQLIWNVLVCALYGPATSRPLLVDSPDLLADQSYTARTDVITDLARTSFTRYAADRSDAGVDPGYPTFTGLPPDLRTSSIAYISSIHTKLETLGYEVLPAGSCHPDRCVTALTESEVECLAILEHRRWLKERTQAGWSYGKTKDVEARQSPYLVPWEELPDRAKMWNRSAVRSIPALLASVNLSVVK